MNIGRFVLISMEIGIFLAKQNKVVNLHQKSEDCFQRKDQIFR